MRKWVALLMALAFAAMSAPLASAYEGQVTIALTGEPPTMDPHAVTNFIGNIVWRWSYDALVSSETETGKIVPWLAEKWERIDPTAYKFRLRKGVKYTDGSPFTAESVKHSMERVLDSPQQRPYFQALDRIEILDDHTFIWRAKGADNGLLIRLARWAQPISLKTKGLDAATISRNTFGTGPYILREWTKGQKMVFEADPNWWANDRYPNRPKTVVLRHIPEGATRVGALLAGEVDIITGVMTQFIPQIEQNPMTRVASISGIRIMFLGFFSRHGGPFADPNIRLAVNYAIDVENVRKTILAGRADISGQLLHPWHYSGHNPDKTWHGYDLEKAKALMKESSHPDGFKADLLATGDGRYPGDRATCEAVAGMLKKIRIDTTCTPMNFLLYRKTFTAYQAGKQEGAAMYYMGLGGGGGDPANAFRALVSCKGSWSGSCFPDLDEAIDKAAATEDLKEQQNAFEKVTDMTKEKATHKVFVKIHDIFGYRKNLEFRPRGDETLFPWEIVMK